MTQLAQQTTTTKLGKVLYIAKVHTTGGRAGGVSRSDDGRLNIKHSIPGTPGAGTNPEQLFAAGWSASFEGAMGTAARKMKIVLPADLAMNAEVGFCRTGGDFFIQASLNVSLPGVERNVAQTLLDAAEQMCPYSKAIQNNVDVAINLV
jgi:lipoyl-dependent peroxiredoxin